MARADRLRWLDALKGWAILLVVFGHVLSGYLDAGTYPEAYYSFYHVRTWIYSFHMPLFFLISGYTFTLAYWREGRLDRPRWGRQLFNLVYIYLLFSILHWSVKQLFPGSVNETYTLEDLKRIFLVPLGNFWYLYVLVIFYLLGALFRMPALHPIWLPVLGGISILAIETHLQWYYLTPYRIVYHLVFFCLGILFQRRPGLMGHKKLMGASCMYLAACCFFYYCLGVRNWYSSWRFMIALTTCFFTVFLFSRSPRLQRGRFLQLCGKNCLEIYLLHTFFTGGLRSILCAIPSPWLSTILNFLISLFLSIAIALLSHRLPFMDLVFRPARFFRRLRTGNS